MSGHNAANPFDSAVALWDADLRRVYDDLCEKESIEARIYELYRNNHHMRGLVDRLVDLEVGPNVQIQPLPDHKALGVERSVAAEWSRQVLCQLNPIVHSAENWISANRSQDLMQMARSAAKMRWMTGEVFCVREWRRSPMPLKTCFQLISSHRVKGRASNSLNRVYHGIELDRYGAAMAYHIESAETDERGGFKRLGKNTRRVAKYTPRGPFWQVCHSFDPLMPEYPRGISPIAAVVVLCKIAEKHSRAILEKDLIAATYALVVTSAESPRDVAMMLATGKEQHDLKLPEGEKLSPELQEHCDSYVEQVRSSRSTALFGSSWIHALPGEEIKVLESDQKNQPTTEFQKDYHRNITGGIGVPYEIASGDFNGVNFSGAQMSAGLFEYMMSIQRKAYGHKVLNFMYRNLLDELMLVRRGNEIQIPLLNGMDYMENREAYAGVEFTGTRRIYADEFKSARSDHIRQADGTTSKSRILRDRGDDPEAIQVEIEDDAIRTLETVQAAFERAGLELTAEQRANVLLQATTQSSVDPAMLIESEPDTGQASE